MSEMCHQRLPHEPWLRASDSEQQLVLYLGLMGGRVEVALTSLRTMDVRQTRDGLGKYQVRTCLTHEMYPSVKSTQGCL